MFWRKSLQQLTDEELMVQATKGSEKAFAEIYSRFAPRLLRFFTRMLNNDRDLAEDKLQDLFFKIIDRPGAYDPAQPLSPWLYRIAANMCRNTLRDTLNRKKLLEENKTEWEESITPSSGLNETDLALFKKEYHRVYHTLEHDQQLLLSLRFQEDLQLKDIALILEVPEGTVRSRLFYLLRKLSTALHEFNPKN